MPARLTAGVAVAIVLVVAGGLWRLWQQDFFWRNPLEGPRSSVFTDFEGDEFDAAIHLRKSHDIPLGSRRAIPRLGEPDRQRRIRQPDQGPV